MSVRTVLLTFTLSLGVLATLLVGAISIWSLSGNVRREAQERVNHDLTIIHSQYQEELTTAAQRLIDEAARFSTGMQDWAINLQRIREKYDLTLLNVCDVDGNPVSGSYPDQAPSVPVSADPVLRRALEGKSVWGTVVLDEDRLWAEGGSALKNANLVYSASAQEKPATTSALFWWIAHPLKDEVGRIKGLLYGGRTLNFNFSLVDDLRQLVFGDERYNGKPAGTVTIFLRAVRVATNVLGPDRKRAVGTRVSNQVQRSVIERGEIWNDRAWVVDEWYISGYHPLSDPDGNVIGMLYVGLLESPYNDLRNQVVIKVAWLALCLLVLAVLLSLIVVGRITSPLSNLSEAASHLSEGNWEYGLKVTPTFREISNLRQVFQDMQRAIVERDQMLREQNRILQETNDKLDQTLSNYMQMLGFITHELKSPLATVQSMISTITEGYAGELPEKASPLMVRIKKILEESQDMVKNYLDLSRVERGEMVASKADIDLRSEVIEPSVVQTEGLFHSRHISLEVEAPADMRVRADPELMRIALTNYLTNAAKYGREGGKAHLETAIEQNGIRVSVWNEGEGFTPDEGRQLFGKFSRLRNPTTADKRGSGLGLFICRQILDLHDGKVWAESEPGQWARFSFRFPIG